MERSPIAGLVLLIAGVGAFLFFRIREAQVLTESNSITADPSTWPQGDRIWDVCRAIAAAEGYDQGRGAAPFDLNNPGDLSPGDEHGFATVGPAEFHGGSSIIHFAKPADGWNALRLKIQNIASGRSNVYSADWSWMQIAEKYAGDAANWSRNVAASLGVDVTSTLADYVTGV
jgi:hypothetical protein